MSTRGVFTAVKYFCGLIFRSSEAAGQAIEMLQAFISPVESLSPVIPFAMTDYYRPEMGEPLFRQFVAFRGLQPPERLPEFKIGAMGVESRLAEDGRRRVNADPGYLSEANVIIATAKNHYHRVPLRDGVYAHIEYVLKDGRLNFLPWTYPDFRTAAYLDFFMGLHGRLKGDRRERAARS